MTSTIESSAPAYSTSEKKRLHDAYAEIQRLETKLSEIEDIRAVITAAEADFVSGKLDIIAAAGLLSVTGDINARSELQARLRRPVKLALKAVVESVSDLLRRASQAKVDSIAEQARELEKVERDSFREHGLPDEFQPSPLLKALRDKHKRALENSKTAVFTKSSLTSLIADIS